jgi:hypothetical protein
MKPMTPRDPKNEPKGLTEPLSGVNNVSALEGQAQVQRLTGRPGPPPIPSPTAVGREGNTIAAFKKPD